MKPGDDWGLLGRTQYRLSLDYTHLRRLYEVTYDREFRSTDFIRTRDGECYVVEIKPDHVGNGPGVPAKVVAHLGKLDTVLTKAALLFD